MNIYILWGSLKKLSHLLLTKPNSAPFKKNLNPLATIFRLIDVAQNLTCVYPRL